MLEINHLVVSYGKRTIIDNQSVVFKRGEVTGIKGKSGAGKSSLLNVLGLLRTPNKECRYVFDGKEVNVRDEEEKALFRMNNIGFIFQQGNLMKNLTAIENVMLPQMLCETDEDIILQNAKRWIQYTGLEVVEGHYPEDLSGGEEQRIAVARALINDCDIILADEPTASLDPENKEKVMSLLTRLAHELNKTVIVVSHDDEVIGYSDTVYEIEKGQICLLRETRDEETPSKRKTRKKKLGGFIRRYERLRRTEQRLNRFLIVVTSVVLAVAALSFGFGEAFTKEQRKFVNSVSDRSLLVINDTLGLDATADYADALAFDTKTIDYIGAIPNVDKVYPYYDFCSYGAVAGFGSDARIIVRTTENEIYEKHYKNTFTPDGEEFSVSPLFAEESIGGYLMEGSAEQLAKDEVYLTYAMAKETEIIPEELIGATITIYCYVPTKLYNSSATKPMHKEDYGGGTEEERIPIDGCVSELVVLEKRIVGILNRSYTNDKSENGAKRILMKYDEMSTVVNDHMDDLSEQTFPDFTEKELAPSMLVVFVTDYDDVSEVEKKVSNVGASVSVVNRGGDIKRSQAHLEGIRNTMLIIAAIMVVVVTVMFTVLYFFRNRERNNEIGILKALGLSQKDVLRLIGTELVQNTIKTILLSTIISFVAQGVVNAVSGIRLLSVSIESILLTIGIAVVAVFGSGVFSVWKTSKIDVIDAIRLNK